MYTPHTVSENTKNGKKFRFGGTTGNAKILPEMKSKWELGLPHPFCQAHVNTGLVHLIMVHIFKNSDSVLAPK